MFIFRGSHKEKKKLNKTKRRKSSRNKLIFATTNYKTLIIERETNKRIETKKTGELSTRLVFL